MSAAFEPDNGPLRLNAGANTNSDRDEQDGFKLIFIGSMLGTRDPKAHVPFPDISDDRSGLSGG
jgi:hypothetical protein